MLTVAFDLCFNTGNRVPRMDEVRCQVVAIGGNGTVIRVCGT